MMLHDAFHPSPAPALRLGMEDEFYAAPFASALAARPDVEVVQAPCRQLADLLQAGQLDCALIPPLVAFRIPFSRFVPGIGIVGTQPFGGEPIVFEHGELWHEIPNMPPVWMVWACRFRAPYPRIRATLWHAKRMVEEQIESSRQCGTERFSYSVASLEADSLRHLAMLAHRHGLFRECPSVEFC